MPVFPPVTSMTLPVKSGTSSTVYVGFGAQASRNISIVSHSDMV